MGYVSPKFPYITSLNKYSWSTKKLLTFQYLPKRYKKFVTPYNFALTKWRYKGRILVVEQILSGVAEPGQKNFLTFV